jgi:iron(III) transport system permease protein
LFNTTKKLGILPAPIIQRQFIISIVLLVVLAYLVLIPLYGIVERTLTWENTDIRMSRDAVPGEFTLFHWKNIILGRVANSFFFKPLVNTLITGSIAAVIALLLGGLLSWFVTRTDMPGRKWLRAVLTLPYIIPSFAIALAWGTLFRSPRIGGPPGFFQVVFGVAPPEWLSYGPIPIIITMVIHFFPFAFLLVSGALATIDTQLEESAELLGASRWMILRKITFPIVAPAFMAAFVLTLGRTIGTFAIAFILAIILIIMTALIVYISNRFLGGNLRRYETVSGKGFKGELTRLGRWRLPIFCLVGVFALITAIFPLGLLSYQTLMLVDGRYGLDNLTLHYWIGQSDPNIAHGEPGVLHNAVILGASWNSIRLAVLSSIICAFFGLIVAYIVVRQRGRFLSTLLDQISFLPFLFPAISFGAMYLSLFAVRHGPIPALYGTFTLLVIISVIKRLPYSVRTGTSAVTQIGQELEEAAEIEGASWFMRIRRIVLPLATSGVVSGLMVSFVGVMRELSLIILLITPKTRVLMTAGLRYVEEDQTQLSNTLVLLVTLITILGELVVWWLGKGRLSRLRERQLAGKGG